METGKRDGRYSEKEYGEQKIMVMQGFITIKVTGLKECQAALDKVQKNAPQIKGLMLEDLTSLLMREAKGKAHVITGDMKRSIALQEIDKQTGKAIVEVGVDYGAYENARGGDHAFWDQAVSQVEKNGLAMVKKRMDAAWKSAGVPVK